MRQKPAPQTRMITSLGEVMAGFGTVPMLKSSRYPVSRAAFIV